MYGFRKGLVAAAFSAAIVAGACAASPETEISTGPTTGGTPAATPSQPGAGSAARTAKDGIYSAAQAERGNTAYRTSCSACHNAQEFTGATFQATWGSQPVGALHRFISEAMPLDNPGGLTNREYTDIVAYIIRQNGYPAGATELPPSPDVLAEIEFGGAP